MATPTTIQTAAGQIRMTRGGTQQVNYLSRLWPLPIAQVRPRYTYAPELHQFILPFHDRSHKIEVIYFGTIPKPLGQEREDLELAQLIIERAFSEIVRQDFAGVCVLAQTLKIRRNVAVPGIALVITDGRRSLGSRGGPVRVNPVTEILAQMRDLKGQGRTFNLGSKPKLMSAAAIGRIQPILGYFEGMCVNFNPTIDTASDLWFDLAQQRMNTVVHMPVVDTKFPGLEVEPEPERVPMARLITPNPPPAATVEPANSGQLQVLSEAGVKRIYRLMAYLAASDGSVVAEEQAVLDEFANRFNLDAIEAAQIFSEGSAGQNLRISENEVERSYLLDLLLDVVAADNVLHANEKRRLLRVAQQLKMPAAELEHRIRERFGGAPVVVGATEPVARLSPNGLRRIYRVMAYVATENGSIGVSELKLLREFQQRYQLSDAECYELQQQSRTEKHLKLSSKTEERRILATKMIQLACADGKISAIELTRLLQFSQLLNLPQSQLYLKLEEELQRRQQNRLITANSVDCTSSPAIILNDFPGQLIFIDFDQVLANTKSVGIFELPRGLHMIKIIAEGQQISCWVEVADETLCLRYNQGHLTITSDSYAVAQTKEIFRQRLIGTRVDSHNVEAIQASQSWDWDRLIAPLKKQRFSPAQLQSFSFVELGETPDFGDLLQRFLQRSCDIEVELCVSFLLSMLSNDLRARNQYCQLLERLYQCNATQALQYKDLFISIIPLLKAQHRRLPESFRAADTDYTRCAENLSAALIESNDPELIEVGRRWALFIAGYHEAAPAIETLPQSFEVPEDDSETANDLFQLTATIQALQNQGADRSRDLLTVYDRYIAVALKAGAYKRALSVQIQLIALTKSQDTRLSLSSEAKSSQMQRLAILYRELGQRARALEMERISVQELSEL